MCGDSTDFEPTVRLPDRPELPYAKYTAQPPEGAERAQ